MLIIQKAIRPGRAVEGERGPVPNGTGRGHTEVAVCACLPSAVRKWKSENRSSKRPSKSIIARDALVSVCRRADGSAIVGPGLAPAFWVNRLAQVGRGTLRQSPQWCHGRSMSSDARGRGKPRPYSFRHQGRGERRIGKREAPRRLGMKLECLLFSVGLLLRSQSLFPIWPEHRCEKTKPNEAIEVMSI